MSTATTNEISSVDLIKGTFDPENANELLMNLLASKIEFHERRNWGLKERLGKRDPISDLRIRELKETKEALTNLLRTADTNGHQLRIEAKITIMPVA